MISDKSLLPGWDQ